MQELKEQWRSDPTLVLLRSHTVGLKAYWRRSFHLRLDGSVIDGFSNTTGHAACNQGKNGAKWGINEGLTQRAKSMFHHVLLAKKEGPPDRQTIKNVGWITTPLWRCYIDERDCTAQQLKEGAAALERKRAEWEKNKAEEEERKAKEKEQKRTKSPKVTLREL